MKIKVTVCALGVLAGICAAWGRSFSLDLRQPQDGGAGARLLSAAPPKDDGALRSFDLDAGVADVGEVAVGDELAFTLFDDVAITLELKEKMPSPLGGDVFIAEASGYEGVKNAVVLRTADGLVVDVHDYLRKRVYKVLSTPSGVAVQEIEAKGRGKCGCDTLRPRISEDAQPVAKAKSARRLLSAGAEDTYVDILVAYEQNASTWVKSYGGGMTNFAQTAVQKMNAALANVGLDTSFRFRLVGVMEVGASSASLEEALNSASGGVREWNAVRLMRNKAGADIVAVLVDTGSAYGMVGLGFSLESDNFSSFSGSAYNACSIRSVAQSHTMTHEVGHNMGCGHSDVQETQPGPQLYDYSAGYYFSADGENFHTIMAYDGDGPGGSEVPYFSSPNHAWRGVAVGDASHDNARTLANTFAVAAGWRDSPGGEISGGEEGSEEEFFYDNDEFSNAKELAGASGRISGSTVDAMGDIEEFLARTYRSRHTVWYKWTADTDGQILVGVEEADFDTVMAAFTGSSARSLTTVAHNDDISSNNNLSILSFDVRQGVTYYICLGGYREYRGDFRLKWEFKSFVMVSVAIADGCEGMGTVSGGGKAVRAGTKVSLKATANKGFAFAGWYLGGELSDAQESSSPLSQTASFTYVATDEPVTIEARFVSTDDDIAGLALNVTNATAAADGTLSLDLGECVESPSLPKLAVSGLPSGLKYDAKTMTISGKATKPGVYAVKVTATNASVKKATPASTATFALTIPNLSCEALPNLEPATGAYGIVRCGVVFDAALVDCSAADGWTVKAAGLPAGLKYDARTGLITGIPTKAGTNTVTFTASRKGEKNQIATITLVTAALPTWAQGAFAGYVAGTRDAYPYHGSATMTVSANGKVSGKVSLDGTNWTFSATSYAAVECPSSDIDDASFVVVATAKAGKLTRVVELAVSGYAGREPLPGDDDGGRGATALPNAVAEGTFGDCGAKMWRNMWKDKATSVAAKAELAKWEGVCTLSMEDGGYLSMTVGKNGDVKATGKLSDGTSVSATSPLLHDGEAGYFSCLYAAPSAYKGGCLALAVGFVASGDEAVDGQPAYRLVPVMFTPQWTSRNPQATGEYGAGFTRDLSFVGAYYDKTKNLNAHYEALRFSADVPILNGNQPQNVDDVDIAIDVKGKIGIDKASGLSLSFTQATGVFKGGWTFVFDAKNKKKVSFEGILVPGAESLVGFYLWDAVGSYEDPKTKRPKTYKYKESHTVELVAP